MVTRLKALCYTRSKATPLLMMRARASTRASRELRLVAEGDDADEAGDSLPLGGTKPSHRYGESCHKLPLGVRYP